MSENSYQILIENLNKFIKKYYKNQIIKGLLYGTSLMLLFYLAVAIPEYFGEFGTMGRSILFWSFIGSSGYIGVRFILIPLFKLLSIGKTLSHDQAAVIVGQHFSNVADKLLNTLQLKELADEHDSPLLEAAIQQRIEELKPIKFTAAVDFGENRKYVKYIVPPLAIIVVILFAAPSILTDSTQRLVRFNEEIIKQAPYQITVLNDALEVPENGNFDLEVALKGEVVPEKFYLVVKGQKFRMKREGMGFTYLFRNIQKDTEFQFYGAGFLSEPFTLKTLPTPRIINFVLALDFPGYTGLKDLTINNTGDITAPEGTRASWLFDTENTSEFTVAFKDTVLNLDHQGKDSFQMGKDLFKDGEYSIQVRNEYLEGDEPIRYQINVIPDHHPSIHVEEERDSLLEKDIFFTGEIQDDYGFKQLVFNYFYLDASGQQKGNLLREKVDISKNSNQQPFFFRWNLSKLNIAPGQELSYYFEVWDNDGVHGSKSSRTRIRTFNAPTLDELQEERDEDSKDIKKELEETMLDAKKIRKELEELRKELLQKEEMSWQDRKKIEDMLKRQRELQKNVENIQNKNDLKNQKESEFSPKNESLLKKQQQLEQLMDQIMSDEMKQMMDELERLMDELNMEEIQEQIEEMDLSTEDIEKELDRALEQFKQLEWEQKMEEALDELEELSKEQEELSEESKKEESDSEEMEKKQEDLEKKFEDWEKKMEDIEKLNEKLEEPNAMPENKEESKEVKEDMNESKEQLKKDKKKKASESQKSAAKKMKEMAEKMDMMMKSGSSEKQEEDMEDLRALLENIISLSFDQEALMENLRNIDKKDPKYVSYAQIQRNLKDDAKMVEDSLFALSKRIIQLQGPVNREISLVNENMESALEQLGERQTAVVNKHQQYVMTSFNNLALLLDEALKEMQKESSCDKPGTGNCEKPGGMGKKPSAGDMKKMQDALSKQLKELKEKGENQGNNKGRSPMSKELAKMAAKQAAIRREIQKMAEKLNEDGSGSGNSLKKIAKEMEEMEKDMVNKKIEQGTLDRQKDIMIRLLKAENAERQREMDQKRKSTEAFDAPISNPLKYSEYQKRKEQEVEMLKTIPPALKPYYRKKVNDYFNKLGD